jgi:hypothetical protein
MTTIHACYHDHIMLESYYLMPSPATVPEMLIDISLHDHQEWGFRPTYGNGVRNICWHSLASLLELVYPSSNTQECQSIGHNIYRGYLQAHGSIVVAFHLEVLSGYRYLYFSIGKHGSKSSYMDMSKIDIRA